MLSSPVLAAGGRRPGPPAAPAGREGARLERSRPMIPLPLRIAVAASPMRRPRLLVPGLRPRTAALRAAPRLVLRLARAVAAPVARTIPSAGMVARIVRGRGAGGVLAPILGGDGLPGQALDVAQLAALVGAAQRDGDAVGPGA